MADETCGVHNITCPTNMTAGCTNHEVGDAGSDSHGTPGLYGIGSTQSDPTIAKAVAATKSQLLALQQKVSAEMNRLALNEVHTPATETSVQSMMSKVRDNMAKLGQAVVNTYPLNEIVYASEVQEVYTKMAPSTGSCACNVRCTCNNRASDYPSCHCNTHCYCNHRCSCDAREYTSCTCNRQCAWISGDGCAKYYRTCQCHSRTAEAHDYTYDWACSCNVRCTCNNRTSAQCPCNVRCPCNARQV